MRDALRHIVLPPRKAANWFVKPPTNLSCPNHVASPDSIIYKATSFAAVNTVEGDYLEFGVFRGGSYISAY